MFLNTAYLYVSLNQKKVDNYVLNHYDVRNVLTLILLSNVLEL